MTIISIKYNTIKRCLLKYCVCSVFTVPGKKQVLFLFLFKSNLYLKNVLHFFYKEH